MSTHQTERSEVCGNTGIGRYICGDRYCGIVGGSMDGGKLLVGTVKNIVECETRQDDGKMMRGYWWEQGRNVTEKVAVQ